MKGVDVIGRRLLGDGAEKPEEDLGEENLRRGRDLFDALVLA
jgi:hypothetical protein